MKKKNAKPVVPAVEAIATPQECPSCAARRAYRTSYRSTPEAKASRRAYQEKRAAAKRAADVQRVLAEAKAAEQQPKAEA